MAAHCDWCQQSRIVSAILAEVMFGWIANPDAICCRATAAFELENGLNIRIGLKDQFTAMRFYDVRFATPKATGSFKLREMRLDLAPAVVFFKSGVAPTHACTKS
jgi:hypothetical protein